jgi:2-oxoglutarate ferredoxin oxidoreductase subunit beta
VRERLLEAPPYTPEEARRARVQGHGVHPLDRFLKDGRIPHIWCPGCGNGIALTAFVKAVEKSGRNPDKTVVVSGIGCCGRAAGYLNFDTYHTTHGRALPFATGLKLANPELNVVVISGEGDLFAIGGNHFIHAARRNMDLTVLCVNNFNYGMTGGQSGPTTPMHAISATTPYGSAEHPFNLIYVAKAAGAVYVSRWTALHTHELRDSIIEAMAKPGFCFIEAISPCPTAHGRRNRLGAGLELMRAYRENAYLADDPDPEETAISLTGRIAVGKFVDIEKPTFLDLYEQHVVSGARGTEKAPPRSGNGSPERKRK